MNMSKIILRVELGVVKYISDDPRFSHLLKPTYINTQHSLYFRKEVDLLNNK